jgi:hypothetical protein
MIFGTSSRTKTGRTRPGAEIFSHILEISQKSKNSIMIIHIYAFSKKWKNQSKNLLIQTPKF